MKKNIIIKKQLNIKKEKQLQPPVLEKKQKPSLKELKNKSNKKSKLKKNGKLLLLINCWLRTKFFKRGKVIGDRNIRVRWQRKVLFFMQMLLMLNYISLNNVKKGLLKKKSKIEFVLKQLINRTSFYKTLTGGRQMESKYGILRVYTGFTNLNFSLTSLNGKISYWINGGCDTTQTKRTRMSTRGLGCLMKIFLKKLDFRQIRYLKILFTGPSKRCRRKFISLIKRRARFNKKNKKRRPVRILCIEEGFRRSFNGCRLARRKR